MTRELDLIEELRIRADTVTSFIDQYLQEKEPSELYTAARHLLHAGGKRLRPCMTILSCEAVGGDPEIVIPAGAAIELVHNFTLIHDDIMDRDDLRRGYPAVHTIWGNAGAILAGDTLYAKSFELITQAHAPPAEINECVRIIAEACVEICEGQWEDIEFENREHVSEDEYLKMVEKKTSALYAASARIGGILGGAERRVVDALGEYGRLVGIGFQIYDDVIDLRTPEDLLGKNRGSDIVKGKKTLIITRAHELGEDIKIFGKKNASSEEIDQAIHQLEECGSIDYAETKAIEYIQKGKKMLKILPNTPSKQLLLDLADYMITRRY